MKCKHCSSCAINIDPEGKLCDKCYYRIPLIDLAGKMENDIEVFKQRGDSEKITLLIIELIESYLKPIQKLNLRGNRKNNA